MKKPRLQHVALPIPIGAQDAVRAFYGGILGFEEKAPPQSLHHLGLVWYAVGDGEMELHFAPGTIAAHPQEGRHFCLEVDNLDAYRHALQEAGYEVTDAEPIPRRPRFFSRDPFGNRFELTTILGDYQDGA